MELPRGFDNWKLACPEEKLGCPEDEGEKDYEPPCVQCEQEKEDDNQNMLCFSCMEENWFDTHGYEFPGGFGAEVSEATLSGQDAWDAPES